MLILFWILFWNWFEPTEAVVPISAYSQETIFNGKLTTRNTVILTCTEKDPIGQFLVGNYTVNVTCVAPAFNYRYTAVGAIPKATQLHIEKTCLVKDDKQFKNAATSALQQTYGVSASDSVTTSNPGARRLLQFLEGASLAIGIAALTISIQNQGRISTLESDMEDVQGGLSKAKDSISNLTSATEANTDAIKLQQREIMALDNKTNLLLGQTNQLQSKYTNLADNVIELSNKTKAQFDAIQDTIARNNIAIQQAADQQFNYTNQQFMIVNQQLISMNQLLQQEIDGLLQNSMQTSHNLNTAVASITKLIRQTELHRLMVQSYFQSADTLDTRLKPFTLGLGIRPALQLFGPDKRILFERVDYNWVTNTTGNRYTIYASQVRFYADSVWAIDNLQYSTTFGELVLLFAANGCSRSYSDADISTDPPGPNCKLWMETRTFACGSNKLSPKFDWANQNHTTLLQSDCTDPIQTIPPVIGKTVDDVHSWFAGDICVTPGSSIRVTGARAATSLLIPANNQCSKSWRDQIYMATQNPSDPSSFSMMYLAILMLSAGFKNVQLDLYNLELKLYGRNPGGFKYEKRDNDYVPTRYNGTTPIYDGSADPVDCTYASWLAVHKQSINMYSIEPLSSPIVRKQVLLSVDGPSCNDPATCYPVGEKDVNANIDLNNDASATLPGNVLVVGELKDLKQGLYDVPSRVLSASSSTSERANTPSYILQKPGTVNTYDLPDWIATNTFLFDPTASVSAELYRYDAAFDNDNYPYCDLKNNLPVVSPNVTTNACIRPYTFNTTLSNLSSVINIYNNPLYPSQCSSLQSNHIYTDYQTELSQSKLNTTTNSTAAFAVASGSNYTVTFWYKEDPVIGDNGAITALAIVSRTVPNVWIKFGVTSNGIPYVDHSGSISSLASNIDIRDGSWHFISWTQRLVSSQFTYSLVIDRTSYGIHTATGKTGFAQPFINYLNAFSPQSISAQAFKLNVYVLTLQRSDVAVLEQCGLSSLPISKCYSSSQEVVLARQDITKSDTVNCLSTGVLLHSDYWFDQLFPLPSSISSNLDQTQLFRGQFTLNFWIRSSDQSQTNKRLFNVAANRASISVQYVSGLFVSLSVNNQTSNLQIWDGLSHFVSVTYDLTVLQVYVDGQLITNAALNALTNPFQKSTIYSDAIFNVKLYDGLLLAQDQLTNEAQCQIDSTMNGTSAVPAIGSCWMPIGQQIGFGYCRHSTSCGGHCTQYSYINRLTGVYTSMNNGCDAGYGQPACNQKCSRIDPISGQCLIDATSKATGITPGSEFCVALNNYKLAVNPSNGLLTFSPRVWQYTVSVGIPNGVVQNVINTGSCPKVSIFGSIDGSIQVLLQNDETDSSVVSVLYAPEGVFLNGDPCESPCCQLSTDITYSVPGRSSFTVTIPSSGCGNETILIQQAANIFDPFTNTSAAATGLCTKLTGTEVQAMVATAFNQPVPTNVESRITLSLNTAADAIRDVVNAIGTQMMNILQLGANVGFESDKFQAVLDAQRAQLANATYNPINLTSNLPVFDVSKLIQSITNDTNDLADYFNRTNRQFLDQSLIISNLSAQVDQKIQDAYNFINATRQNLDAMGKFIDAIDLDFNSDDPLGDFFKKAAKIAGDVALDVAHVGETFLDKGLNLLGIPGNLLGGFGNIIGGLVKFVFFGLIIYGVYVLIKFLSAKKTTGDITSVFSNLFSSSGKKYQKVSNDVGAKYRQSPAANQIAARLQNTTRKMYNRHIREKHDDDEFESTF